MGRRSSISNVSLSPGTSSVSSISSREQNPASPLTVSKKDISDCDAQSSRCTVCEVECSGKDDFLSCRYCSRLVNILLISLSTLQRQIHLVHKCISNYAHVSEARLLLMFFCCKITVYTHTHTHS